MHYWLSIPAGNWKNPQVYLLLANRLGRQSLSASRFVNLKNTGLSTTLNLTLHKIFIIILIGMFSASTRGNVCQNGARVSKYQYSRIGWLKFIYIYIILTNYSNL